MAQITITFDPKSTADVADARRLVDLVARAATAAPPTIESSVPGPALHERITSLIAGYGEGRRSYMRVIAEASPEAARYRDIEKLFTSPKAIGGTHSSIERSWRSMGGTADVIATDMNGNSRMAPDVAAMVLSVLSEVEAEERA